jgi:Putative transposase
VVSQSANDRAGVERLCRYVLRPPFAQERLRLRGDGRVALELKRAWHDGTRELVFEPLEFVERLAAMTPRPETNLLICHGVLYVGPMDGATAAGGRSCCLSSENTATECWRHQTG